MIVEGSQFLSLKSVKLLLTKVIGKKLIPPKAKARLNHEQNPAPPPSLPSKQLYKEQNICPDKNPTFLQINLLYILSVQDFLYSHLYHWPQTTCNQETLCPFLVKRRMSPTPVLLRVTQQGLSWNWRRVGEGVTGSIFNLPHGGEKSKAELRAGKAALISPAFILSPLLKCSPLGPSVPQTSQTWLPCFHTNHKGITTEIPNKGKSHKHYLCVHRVGRLRIKSFYPH